MEPAEGDPAGPALPAPTVDHDAAPTGPVAVPTTAARSNGHRAPAATAGVVTGRVTTTDGSPVVATLTATDSGGHQIGRTRTDADGGFTLPARPGSALLIATAPGHAPRAETLTIGVGGTRHDVVLEPTGRSARTPVAGS
ncbi:carboxypeptidase-like regulatory domain-containing protein [Actinomycetospora atypica]|uniref:Carboxypeptidase-like regulatory domain-containing protein n=1 Tax=Actinomycetospora atypica TaxID=1290095 RepID=A0ABV9YG41_9PSEU